MKNKLSLNNNTIQDENLSLNKLNIQNEIKEKILNIQINKITQYDKDISNLKQSYEKLKQNFMNNVSISSSSNSSTTPVKQKILNKNSQKNNFNNIYCANSQIKPDLALRNSAVNKSDISSNIRGGNLNKLKTQENFSTNSLNKVEKSLIKENNNKIYYNTMKNNFDDILSTKSAKKIQNKKFENNKNQNNISIEIENLNKISPKKNSEIGNFSINTNNSLNNSIKLDNNCSNLNNFPFNIQQNFTNINKNPTNLLNDSSNNLNNHETLLTKMMNLDFLGEKCHIISNSPINSPKIKYSSIQTDNSYNNSALSASAGKGIVNQDNQINLNNAGNNNINIFNNSGNSSAQNSKNFYDNGVLIESEKIKELSYNFKHTQNLEIIPFNPYGDFPHEKNLNNIREIPIIIDYDKKNKFISVEKNNKSKNSEEESHSPYFIEDEDEQNTLDYPQDLQTFRNKELKNKNFNECEKSELIPIKQKSIRYSSSLPKNYEKNFIAQENSIINKIVSITSPKNNKNSLDLTKSPVRAKKTHSNSIDFNQEKYSKFSNIGISNVSNFNTTIKTKSISIISKKLYNKNILAKKNSFNKSDILNPNNKNQLNISDIPGNYEEDFENNCNENNDQENFTNREIFVPKKMIFVEKLKNLEKDFYNIKNNDNLNNNYTSRNNFNNIGISSETKITKGKTLYFKHGGNNSRSDLNFVNKICNTPTHISSKDSTGNNSNYLPFGRNNLNIKSNALISNIKKKINF